MADLEPVVSSVKPKWQPPTFVAWAGRHLVAIGVAFAVVVAIHLALEQSAFSRTETIVGASVRPETGYAFHAPLPPWFPPWPFLAEGDSSGSPGASRLLLFEGQVPLGPGHSLHSRIRSTGDGAFSHWGSGLYFSLPDNHILDRSKLDLTFQETTRLSTGLLCGLFLAEGILVIILILGIEGHFPAFGGRLRKLRGRLFLALLLGSGLSVAGWQRYPCYSIAPDSLSYVEALDAPGSREVGYATFIEVVAGLSAVETRIRELIAQKGVNVEVCTGNADPLQRVKKAQVTVVAAGLALLFLALSGTYNPLLTGGLIALIGWPRANLLPSGLLFSALPAERGALSGLLLILVGACVLWTRVGARRCLNVGLGAAMAPVLWMTLLLGRFQLDDQQRILSEALAAGLLYSFGGAIFLYVTKGRPVWLLCAAACAGLAIHVRPALLILPVVMGLAWGVVSCGRWKRNSGWLVFAATSILLILAAPRAIRTIWLGQDVPAVSGEAHTLVHFGLQLASSADVPRIKDEVAKEFLRRALTRRREFSGRLESSNELPTPSYLGLTNNAFQIAIPVASGMVREYPEIKDRRRLREVYSAAGLGIVEAHPTAYLRIMGESIRDLLGLGMTPSRYSRLDDWLPFAATAPMLLVAAAILRNRRSLAALLLASIHVLAMVLVATLQEPTERYAALTEAFIPIAQYCMIYELFSLPGAIPGGETRRAQESCEDLPARRVDC